MKKVLWVLPVLTIGIGIGGLALPNVFAAANGANTPPAQAQQYMQQALNTPQGQAMLQSCNNFMGQYTQNQK